MNPMNSRASGGYALNLVFVAGTKVCMAAGYNTAQPAMGLWPGTTIPPAGLNARWHGLWLSVRAPGQRTDDSPAGDRAKNKLVNPAIYMRKN